MWSPEHDQLTTATGLSWYRALTLSERLISQESKSSHLHSGNDGQRALALQKLAWWKALPSFQNDEGAFAERLAAEGLSEEELVILLAEPVEVLQQRLPNALPWVETLLHTFAYCSESPAPKLNSEEIPSGRGDQGCEGFLPIFMPLLHMAQDHLHGHIQKMICHLNISVVPFNPGTVTQLFLPLLAQHVIELTSKVLILELHIARMQGRLHGATPEERFTEFVQQYSQPQAVIALLERYPVLGCWLVRTLKRWQTVALELLRRLCEDWVLICATLMSENDPGVLIGLEGNAGDPHRGGRAVCLLTFSSGYRLVYKPRSLAVDRHFQELLAWINSQHIVPYLHSPRILDRETYGWSEFIAVQECTSVGEVERFMVRLGAYLALLYVLAGIDMHGENLCAAGEYPILLDLECLFHPPSRQPPSVFPNPASDVLRASVLTTGVLPYRLWSSKERVGIDRSTMQAAVRQVFPNPLPSFDHAKTDQMYLTRQYRELLPIHNRLLLQGQEVEYCQYQDQLIAGFTRVYRLFIEQRTHMLTNWLPRFAQDETRHLMRPTEVYALLLRERSHPDVVQDALDQERYLDRLWMITNTHPHLRRLVAIERADLWEGDIPAFWTTPSSRALFSSQGSVLPDFFEETGLEVVHTRLLSLHEKDLACQIWMIRAAIASTVLEDQKRENTWCLPFRPHSSIPSGSATPERLQHAALTLGDRLASLALFHGNDIGWLDIVFCRSQEWKILAANNDLYSGLSGIALFMAYLGKIGQSNRFTYLARQIVSVIQQRFSHTLLQISHQQTIGVFQGLSGVCYLFAHLAVLWHDLELLAAAWKSAITLSPLIEHDEQFDLFGGSAGYIAALLTLYTVTPSSDLLALARKSANYLIERLGLASVWTTNDHAHRWAYLRERGVMTGLAHGAAGIALSLVRLAGVTGEHHYLRAALVLLAFERSCFFQKYQNWQRLFKQTPFPHTSQAERQERVSTELETPEFGISWCHGAPGIGLSRFAMRGEMADPFFDREIDSAIQTTLHQGFGRNHSLCHGDLGNLELLLTAQQYGMQQHNTELARLTALLLECGETHGWVCGTPQRIEAPGLMTGLAGIGYQLLRLSAPTAIPNILVLAQPPEYEQSEERKAALFHALE
jgi:type 2 lantibiotic biosynthesis protein LanM